jgi:putative tryptophan/tyrosine transport system substrate-binding protein
MRRRDFIASLGAMWPLPVRAQQTLPVIGFLSSRSPEDSDHLLPDFHAGLRENGYVAGQNVSIEFRWASGQYERLPHLAADLVRGPVSVLASLGGEPAAIAAKHATSTIPIVFAIGGDPISSGLVASFNRPGGNATGITLLTSALEAKRLSILHELVPTTLLISVLIDPKMQHAPAQAAELEAAARVLRIELLLNWVSTDQELSSAFSAMEERRPDAVLVAAAPFFETRRDQIISRLEQVRLPALFQFREYAVAGGLVSYGIKVADAYRQVGRYAGRILRGATPAELPVLQADRFELVINLRTAKALGLTIPPTLLARADEVIE